MHTKNPSRYLTALCLALVTISIAACHRKVDLPPLREHYIARTDAFFDVWPTGPERAFIAGTRGKLLLTEDAGKTFKRIDLGHDLAVYAIQMADADTGYLCGQDGLL